MITLEVMRKYNISIRFAAELLDVDEETVVTNLCSVWRAAHLEECFLETRERELK